MIQYLCSLEKSLFLKELFLNVENIVNKFDNYLHSRSLQFECVIIGGAALNILGVIQRETSDIDCLDPKIPIEVLNASVEFKKSHPELMLAENWLNNGPDSLVNILPTGWRLRIYEIYSGKARTLYSLGRSDFLKTKLFAYCDRDIDLNDCLAMKPTKEELLECLNWVVQQDAHPGWKSNVENHFLILAQELKYE